MRVGLDITQAVKHKGRGIANYIRQVVPRLEHTNPPLNISLCIRGGRWMRRSLVAGLAPGSRRAWLPFNNPGRKPGFELFHSFGNHLPAKCPVPRTFTVHDFRTLDRPQRRGIGSDRLRRNIERANGIICLTEHGKKRLVHHYPHFDASNIAVVPHGVDHSIFFPLSMDIAQATARKYGLEAPFVLQLGSWFPHKNLELSMNAFAQSLARAKGYRLVFVGGGATREFRASLDALTNTLGIVDGISWIEDASWRDIPGLLAAASCMLQPSRYEGFALPVLEAMAVGTPGVVSDSSCLPEVSGGIWPIAGPDDIEGFITGIDSMLLDEERRQIAVQAGIERAAGYSWEVSAAKTAEFFYRIFETQETA